MFNHLSMPGKGQQPKERELEFHCGLGYTCRVNVGKGWEGEPAEHKTPMAGPWSQ